MAPSETGGGPPRRRIKTEALYPYYLYQLQLLAWSDRYVSAVSQTEIAPGRGEYGDTVGLSLNSIECFDSTKVDLVKDDVLGRRYPSYFPCTNRIKDEDEPGD